jgi:hypothetical protein
MLVSLTLVMGRLFLPFGVASLFLLLFSGTAFMGMYAAYPKIKKYMIDPYYTKTEAEG